MPVANCGFSETPDLSGSALLELHGPTLQVKVGLDTNFSASHGLAPQLPPDMFNALVDTGAAISCIDNNLATSLNLPFVGTSKFGGAAGVSEHPVVLAQIQIPDLSHCLYGTFAAVDLSGQPHLVLLGRNLLRSYRMIYDGRTGQVMLENISPTG